MKTQYYSAATLDGFIATSDHSLDWLMQFGDMDDSTYPAFISQIGALAMGSKTYEWVAQHLDGAGWPYQQPAWVFTSRVLPTIPHADIRFVRGDVRPIHQAMRLAAGEKNLWIVGGGELAGQFYDHGLLDELIIQIAPVTLGGGAPLFPRALWNPPLKLLSTTTFGNAFVEIRYEVPKKPEGAGEKLSAEIS